MMVYNIVLSKQAQKTLDKFSDNIAEPILDAIEALGQNPRPHGFRN